MNQRHTPEPTPRDPLGDFIATHREDFDRESPPPAVWEALTRELEPSAFAKTGPTPAAHSARVMRLYPYWRKLAVACMLLTIGVLSGLLIGQRFADGDESVAYGSNRVQRLEAGYRAELDRRVAQVSAHTPDSALRAELVSLSQPDLELQRELTTLGSVNEQLVLEALAREYEAKLQALEHVLARLRAAERPTPAYAPNVDDSPRVQRL